MPARKPTTATTKTIRRTFAVMDRQFTYEYYGKNVVKKGARLRVGNRGYGYQLLEEGLLIILGHGADEIIPRDRFHLEVEEEVVTVTKKPARRV